MGRGGGGVILKIDIFENLNKKKSYNHSLYMATSLCQVDKYLDVKAFILLFIDDFYNFVLQSVFLYTFWDMITQKKSKALPL